MDMIQLKFPGSSEQHPRCWHRGEKILDESRWFATQCAIKREERKARYRVED